MTRRADPASFPRRFRRRIALLFVGACSVAAGALAVVAFALSWTYRWDRFEDRTAQRAATAAALVDEDVRPLEIPQVVGVFQQLGFGDVVAVRDADSFSSSENLSRRTVPSTLLGEIEPGSSTYVERGGVRYRVVAHPIAESPTTLYFFFPTSGLTDSLRELALILGFGWVGVTAAAGVIGAVAARRVLTPVRRAADAAHALAEGMLDTRLPVTGSDEFATWALSFNEMADALQTKLAELSAAHERERRFTGNVSHELMTPIGALVTEASVLETQLDALPASSRRMVELVIADVRRLRRLTEELLELARLDQASAVERLQPLVLVDAVEAAARSVAAVDAIRLRVDPHLVVCSDRPGLDRVLTNLLANALRHGAPPVDVSAETNAGVVLVHIDDHGPGLSSEEQELVFDRFYKSDLSRSTKGAGLGLAIVRETSRLIDAHVSVTTSPAGGARFTIRLPADTS